MDVVEGKLTCERQAEYGYDTVEIRTPAVISVGDATNEPRYPSLGAMESGLFHLEKASRSAHPEAAPRAVYWLGVALAKKGNVSLARAALQQAAATGPPELRDAALEELSALGSV